MFLSFKNIFEGDTTNISICVQRDDWLQVLNEFIITHNHMMNLPMEICIRYNTDYIPRFTADYPTACNIKNKYLQRNEGINEMEFILFTGRKSKALSN